MKIYVFLFSFLALIYQTKAQTIEEKVATLIELDGTIRNIKNVIDQHIDYQKQTNVYVSETYWQDVTEKVYKKSLADFTELVTPIYVQNFTEAQIDRLIALYNTETA